MDLILKSFFSQNEPSHFSGQSKLLGILRATPPTVLCHFFKLYRRLGSWYENVHIVWILVLSSDFFCNFSHKLNLVIFPTKVNRY